MVGIDHLEETREVEIVGQNLTNLFREGRRGFVRRLPFREDDGDLDKGRSIDIKIDPRLNKERYDETEKEKEEEISFYPVESVITGFFHTALFLRQ
jgi:hypothetical protein